MPQIAALLIVVAGFALMLQLRRIAVSLFIVALSVLVLPALLEPLIEPAVEGAFKAGRDLLDRAPWWAIAGVGAIGSLLLLQAVLALVFGRRVADTTVGTLLAAGIQLALRTLIIGPFRLLVALARSLL